MVGLFAVALVVFFAFGDGRDGDDGTTAAVAGAVTTEAPVAAASTSSSAAVAPEASSTSQAAADSPDGASSEDPATTSTSDAGGRADGDRPVIHLTFDDGPSELTPRVMDLLEQYGARGTFFVMGEAVEAHPEIAREIVQRGHAIANHSYDHMDWRQLGAREDIIRTQDIIRTTTGVTPSCARPPFGADDPTLLATLTELGMMSWRWDLATEDHTDQKFLLEETLSSIPVAQKIWAAEGLIILQHDSSLVLEPSIDGLEAWLAGNADDYEFKVIDDCLSYQ